MGKSKKQQGFSVGTLTGAQLMNLAMVFSGKVPRKMDELTAVAQEAGDWYMGKYPKKGLAGLLDWAEKGAQMRKDAKVGKPVVSAATKVSSKPATSKAKSSTVSKAKKGKGGRDALAEKVQELMDTMSGKAIHEAIVTAGEKPWTDRKHKGDRARQLAEIQISGASKPSKAQPSKVEKDSLDKAFDKAMEPDSGPEAQVTVE